MLTTSPEGYVPRPFHPDAVADGRSVSILATGVPELDGALGVGGWPMGRLCEVYGLPETGVTTALLLACAECQRAGGTAAFIDADQTFDPARAAALGVDVSRLIVAQPDSGEQAFDIITALVRSAAVHLVVVDSVASLIPEHAIAGEEGEDHARARLMSKRVRNLCALVGRTDVGVLFANQVRLRRGVTFGPAEMTCGGNALKYYATVRVELRRVTEGVGRQARVVKNKLAPPFVLVDFRLPSGVDDIVVTSPLASPETP